MIPLSTAKRAKNGSSVSVRERERDLIYYGDKSMIALTEIVARENLHWFFELIIGCVSFAVVRRFWCIEQSDEYSSSTLRSNAAFSMSFPFTQERASDGLLRQWVVPGPNLSPLGNSIF